MSKKQRDVKKMIEKRRYELAIIMSTLSTLLKVDGDITPLLNLKEIRRY